MGLFEAMEQYDTEKERKILTVVKGVHVGEKALFSKSRLLWENKDHGFFHKHQEIAEKITESGIINVEEEMIFCDIPGQQIKLVICGGGHVSIPIIQLGQMMGNHVTVIEDRPKFADHARRAGASEVFCEPFQDALKKIKGGRDTFFVIVTRGHRYDQICLFEIAKKEHAYIGMMGSKKRVATVKKQLIEDGADPQVIENIYSPIGLSIGAETPEEIAVAIAAEMIQVKNMKKRTSGYTKEMLHAIREKEDTKILATIVTRKGSAPRAVGTKMLILPDGNCIGTIGGGCMEADVVRKARTLMGQNESNVQLCRVDMTGADAEEEGMVCGGIVDVFLEKI